MSESFAGLAKMTWAMFGTIAVEETGNLLEGKFIVTAGQSSHRLGYKLNVSNGGYDVSTITSSIRRRISSEKLPSGRRWPATNNSLCTCPISWASRFTPPMPRPVSPTTDWPLASKDSSGKADFRPRWTDATTTALLSSRSADHWTKRGSPVTSTWPRLTKSSRASRFLSSWKGTWPRAAMEQVASIAQPFFDRTVARIEAISRAVIGESSAFYRAAVNKSQAIRWPRWLTPVTSCCPATFPAASLKRPAITASWPAK